MNKSSHPLYQRHQDILKRCTKPHYSKYKMYGARGITVCDRWLDFNNFVEDMYPTFEEGLSIDRIDNYKGYTPENCRWVTQATQNQNMRRINVRNTSGYRGVHWDKKNKKWRLRITVNGKTTQLGYFDNVLEAAKVRDIYIIENKLEHTLNGVL